MNITTSITLTFPSKTTAKEAVRITKQMVEGLRIDLAQAGSDMWPGRVPKVKVTR